VILPPTELTASRSGAIAEKTPPGEKQVLEYNTAHGNQAGEHFKRDPTT